MASVDAKHPNRAPQTVVVASQNPVKINAALKGFTSMFPVSTYTASGISVPSGVSEQPLSNDETLQGALNRVQNAHRAKPGADYYVGIEGGLHTDGASFQSFAWVVVMGKEGRTGKARTATYYLPEEIAKLVRDGMELGQAGDVMFSRSNSKQHNGSTGLLTDDVVDRSTFYEQAVILALIPFKNPTLTF